MDQAHFWNTRYQQAGDDYLFGVAPNHFLTQHAASFVAGEQVLAIADGEGRNSVWLAEQGLDITAVEIAPVAVEKARTLARQRNVQVRYYLGDMLAPGWPPADFIGHFDWVVGIFIQFAAGEDRTRQFAAMQRATRAGGRILLLGYTPKQLEYRTGGPPNVENLYTEAWLREAFDGWNIETLIEYEATLDEGTAHTGRSALIGLVARKPTTAKT